MKNTILTIAVVIALVLSVVSVFGLFTGERSVIVENIKDLGAFPGPDFYDPLYFIGGFSVGGGQNYATSSTAATYTLTTTELPNDRRYQYMTWLANLNTTLTTMASSSAPFSSLKVGESYSIDLYSSTTTAAATITFAAGTGIDLQKLRGGSVIVNGLEGATLKFIKKANTDVMVLVAPWQVGD